jgi:thiosulfate/3-mercaptopyruvate sulfurtransferase
MMDIETRGYVNPDLLWSPEMLRARLGEPGVSIIDTRPAELFAAGRIAGARHFDPYFVNCDDTDPAPLASFTRMWANLLGWRGVKASDTIVFYGEFTDMCAARAFWFAEYLGHERAHVLDGGVTAWTTAGMPLEDDGEPPMPVKFAYRVAADRVATYTDILQAKDNPDCIILDNRSRAEFTGEDCRATHGGAIPTARHRDWEDLYDAATGCMRPASTLRDAFESLGATPDKEITVYCNTGFRSAHAYLALRLLNYPRVRNYVGSWQEWGNRDGMPIWQPDPATEGPPVHGQADHSVVPSATSRRFEQ